MIFMESVTFSYGKSEICSGLSINIPTGEIFGLVGASGAGKTRTRDPLLAKPITQLLVVKPHLPSCEDAIKAYKAIVR